MPRGVEASRYTLPPGRSFDLSSFATDDVGPFDDKDQAGEPTAANLEKLQDLHERLFADASRGLLIVLQAMDTGGKDSTIKHVMGAFNPQGVRVHPFIAPTAEELAHDFLWRVHRVAPKRGSIAIFNRSHYEDVLIVRVKELVPRAEWSRRYDHINAFERLLTDSGIAIVKLYLHISPDEQAERLRKRQSRPSKHWKFDPGDLGNRALWTEYMKAYEEALTRCNTSWAPWHVVPADHKWYRNLLVSQILVDTLEAMNLSYPPPPDGIEAYEIPEV